MRLYTAQHFIVCVCIYPTVHNPALLYMPYHSQNYATVLDTIPLYLSVPPVHYVTLSYPTPFYTTLHFPNTVLICYTYNTWTSLCLYYC